MHFDNARGTALGLAQTATGFAGALIPPLLVPYVAEHGWRQGYVALALVAFLSMPVVLLLIGDLRRQAHAGQPRTMTTGLTVGQAIRTPVFGMLAIVIGLAAIGIGGVIVHLVPMLTDAGLTPAQAGQIAGFLGIAIILGRVLTGIAVDRVFAPRVGMVVFALAACGCGLLSWGGAAMAPWAAVLIGLAMGAEVDLISYLIARYFGLIAYGRIYGWLYAVFMIGTSIGPVIAGAAFDRFGNYQLGMLMLGAALALASLGTLRLQPFPQAHISRSRPGAR
jgi:cyanate permease